MDRHMFAVSGIFRYTSVADADPCILLQFGAGSRTCIGKHISLLEMRMLVPVLYHHFRFDLAELQAGLSYSCHWVSRGLLEISCNVTERSVCSLPCLITYEQQSTEVVTRPLSLANLLCSCFCACYSRVGEVSLASRWPKQRFDDNVSAELVVCGLCGAVEQIQPAFKVCVGRICQQGDRADFKRAGYY